MSCDTSPHMFVMSTMFFRLVSPEFMEYLEVLPRDSTEVPIRYMMDVDDSC